MRLGKSISLQFLVILSLTTIIKAARILDATSTNCELEGLELVNQLRGIHQVSQLQLNTELTKTAVKWGNRILKRAEKDHYLKPWFAHPKTEGEAVFVDTENVTATTAVMSWYCEAVNHNFTSPSFNPKTAQFSQLVWKETKSMGIAKVVDEESGNVVIVARFLPVGNFGYETSFKSNVFEPTSWDTLSECRKRYTNNITGIETTTELLATKDEIGRYMPQSFSTTTSTPAPTTTTTKRPTTPSPPRPDPMGKVVRELNVDDDR